MQSRRPNVRDPLRALIHKHVFLRRFLTVAILAAGVVLYHVAQAATNPSELHLSPKSLAVSTAYQDAVRRCQKLLTTNHKKHFCSELAFAPQFDPPPSIAQAAREGIALFANPQHGVGINANGPIDSMWNYETGLWGGHGISHWWESAMALRTLVRYLEVTHNTDAGFQTILDRTYDRERTNPFAIAKPNFVNLFGDDTAWWGLAWLEASKYELNVRHDMAEARKFLWLAAYDANYIARQPKKCGGVEWKIKYPPDTITGAEYATLVAELYSYTSGDGPLRSPHASQWLAQARQTIAWLERTRLINVRTGRLRNGLDPTCKQRLGGPLTYTQGQVADALVALGSALHDNSYYRQAHAFLAFALSDKSGMVNQRTGILQEACERFRDGCTSMPQYLDLLSWKGILMQALQDYRAATGSTEYDDFIVRQGSAIVANSIRQPDGQPGRCDGPATCQFVFYWGWPLSPNYSGHVDQSTQMDALDALTAALAVENGAQPPL